MSFDDESTLKYDKRDREVSYQVMMQNDVKSSCNLTGDKVIKNWFF